MNLSPIRLRDGWRRTRERWLLGAAAVVVATCLFKPTLPWRRELVEQIVALDISQSMNVQDMRMAGRPVSRLAFAKEALRHALLDLPCGSKIGWAAFTDNRSYLLLAPLEVCEHLDELRQTLDGIDNRMAWIGGSEVAKGLRSGLAVARDLTGKPALVFVTDGHEAPPVNPRHRPPLDAAPGTAAGLVVGVGGPLPLPIPKTDPIGRPIGVWAAGDVMQTDPRSQGRGGSVGGERMADDAAAADATPLQATPGSEHLSALHDNYLRLLAGEAGIAYHRLDAIDGLAAAMAAPPLARPTPARADARIGLALLALALLLWRLIPRR